jgi:hypothetical protein
MQFFFVLFFVSGSRQLQLQNFVSGNFSFFVSGRGICTCGDYTCGNFVVFDLLDLSIFWLFRHFGCRSFVCRPYFVSTFCRSTLLVKSKFRPFVCRSFVGRSFVGRSFAVVPVINIIISNNRCVKPFEPFFEDPEFSLLRLFLF